MIVRNGFVSNSSSSSFIIRQVGRHGIKIKTQEEITEEFLLEHVLDKDISIEASSGNYEVTMESIAKFLVTGKGQGYSEGNDSSESQLKLVNDNLKESWIMNHFSLRLILQAYGEKYPFNFKFASNQEEHDLIEQFERNFILNNLIKMEDDYFLDSKFLHNVIKILRNNFLYDWKFGKVHEKIQDLRFSDMDESSPEEFEIKRKELYLEKKDIFDTLFKPFIKEAEYLGIVFDADIDPIEDDFDYDNIGDRYSDFFYYNRILGNISEFKDRLFQLIFEEVFNQISKTGTFSDQLFTFEVQGAGDGWKSAESNFLYNKGGISFLLNNDYRQIKGNFNEIIDGILNDIINQNKEPLVYDFNLHKSEIDDLIVNILFKDLVMIEEEV